MVEFIGRYSRNWCKLVSLMLPIQLVVHLSNPTPNRFYIRIGPPRKKCRALLGENLRLFVLPWWPLQGIFSNARVIWYSDNQNVESILLNASRKLDLQV